MSNETGLSSFDKLGIGFSSNGGGGGNNPIPAETLTKTQLDDRILEGSLVLGAFYFITGVDVNLYGGTTVLLQATSTNTIGSVGYGLFYTPKYTGTANGVWDNTNPYAIGDTASWGGYVWENLTGNVGFNIGDFELNDGDWDKIAYNTTDYNVWWDEIKYSYTDDWITYRADKFGNVVDGVKFGIDIYGESSIKLMQWGNQSCIKNVIINSYCAFINSMGNIENIVTENNSYIASLTINSNCAFSLINLASGAYIDTLTLKEGCSFYYVTLSKNSYIASISLDVSSTFYNVSVGVNSNISSIATSSNCNINNISVGNSSSLVNFNLDNIDFKFVTICNNSIFSDLGVLTQELTNLTVQDNCTSNIDISAATTIYQLFAKTIFAREYGKPRLSYWNDSDVQVIVDVDN